MKPPRFSFEKVDKVSVSFRDAEVIISDCSRTKYYGRIDSLVFDGVYSFEDAHVYKADQANQNRPYNILISLVDDL